MKRVFGKRVYDMIGKASRVYRSAMVLSLGCSFVFGQGLAGQAGIVQLDENIRASENGALLGRINKGLGLKLLTARDSWMQFNLEGWVWEASLQLADRGDFELVVSALEGENIRDRPQGTIIGRLENGTLLESVERNGGWVRVERKVWIWAQSVDMTNDDIEVERSDLGTGGGTIEWLTLGEGSLPILDGPNGDTLFRALPRATLGVLAREGNWAKVTVNGWIWAPEFSQDLMELPVIVDVEMGELGQRPEELEGRFLQWNLQFISMEEADEIRSDFYQNEKFLVTRLVESEDSFIYVTVSPDLIEEVSFLNPLDHFRVVGRLRTSSEKLTEVPILELISFEKISSEK